MLSRPVLRGEQHRGGAVAERGAVAGGHGGCLALAEDRLEGGELLDGRVRTQVVVALDAAEGGDLVVEEATVVRRRHLLVRRGGQLVLRLAGDPPLQRGEGGVLAHRQPGAGLAVLRDLQADVAGADLAQRGQLAHGVPSAVDPHQLLAEPVADRDRSVRGGVGATGDADVDLAQGDLVRDLDRGLEPGAARLLDVGGRGLGRELRAEHRLARQVEVAGVLEHRAGDHLAEALALEAVAGHEPVDGGGQHLLVGDVGVDGVGPGERDAVATEHGDATGRGVHPPILVPRPPCGERSEGHVTNCGRGVARRVTPRTPPIHLTRRTFTP